ncbi:MAG: DUF6266 family protein [Prolixibacteraceae bacterium]|jgi:hypothetical protein|nr:DUF6266 family protein [Prolixibacteraceae bacterium]
MTVVSNPLIGKSSGSVGGVTFTSWKGINVIKTKPAVVANPKSDKQTAQRAAFSSIVSIYRVMVSILVLGFKELAIKKSTFNAFVSVNLKNAYNVSAPPAADLVASEIVISKGTISATPLDSAMLSAGAGTAIFDFDPAGGLPGQSASDKPLMAVFNETQGEWLSGVGTATRADGSDTLDIPATWLEADTFHAYLGFTNIAGDQASDSDHFTDSISV